MRREFCQRHIRRHLYACCKHEGSSFSTFDDCDVRGAEIDATDFSGATLIDTDLRAAKVTSFNIKGADLDKAFPSLDFAVRYFKEHGANSINSSELFNVDRLFSKGDI